MSPEEVAPHLADELQYAPGETDEVLRLAHYLLIRDGWTRSIRGRDGERSLDRALADAAAEIEAPWEARRGAEVAMELGLARTGLDLVRWHDHLATTRDDVLGLITSARELARRCATR